MHVWNHPLSSKKVDYNTILMYVFFATVAVTGTFLALGIFDIIFHKILINHIETKYNKALGIK